MSLQGDCMYGVREISKSGSSRVFTSIISHFSRKRRAALHWPENAKLHRCFTICRNVCIASFLEVRVAQNGGRKDVAWFSLRRGEVPWSIPKNFMLDWHCAIAKWICIILHRRYGVCQWSVSGMQEGSYKWKSHVGWYKWSSLWASTSVMDWIMYHSLFSLALSLRGLFVPWVSRRSLWLDAYQVVQQIEACNLVFSSLLSSYPVVFPWKTTLHG